MQQSPEHELHYMALARKIFPYRTLLLPLKKENGIYMKTVQLHEPDSGFSEHLPETFAPDDFIQRFIRQQSPSKGDVSKPWTLAALLRLAADSRAGLAALGQAVLRLGPTAFLSG